MFDLSDKKITLIGGGTGNSVLLKSLKEIGPDISVIVSVGDDGGSSGVIRRDFGTIPPGDIRNCLVALSEEDSLTAKLMDKRFTQGFLKKQNLGNIILTALYELTGSYKQAIKEISRIMACRGSVIPVTEEFVNLKATYKDGKSVTGESALASYALRHKTAIDKISLIPENTKLNGDCIKAVIEADLIIFSPGSLYTSLIPNLAVEGLCEAIEKSCARKVYLPNIMSEPGETDGYKTSDLLDALERHSGGYNIVDTVLYSTSVIPGEIIDRYRKKKADIIKPYFTDEQRKRYCLIAGDIALITEGVVRHNGQAIFKILEEKL